MSTGYREFPGSNEEFVAWCKEQSALPPRPNDLHEHKWKKFVEERGWEPNVRQKKG
jgi:hypothetical protein